MLRYAVKWDGKKWGLVSRESKVIFDMVGVAYRETAPPWKGTEPPQGLIVSSPEGKSLTAPLPPLTEKSTQVLYQTLKSQTRPVIVWAEKVGDVKTRLFVEEWQESL